MLILFVLKTPFIGLMSSIAVLSVLSGKSLFLDVLSSNTFCVASGNLIGDGVFVTSGTVICGGGV